ncbi:hypothetical protein PG988_010752 [Apiospora saccharicola]
MVASSYPSSSSPGSSSFHDSVMLDKAQLWGSDICVPGRAPESRVQSTARTTKNIAATAAMRWTVLKAAVVNTSRMLIRLQGVT